MKRRTFLTNSAAAMLAAAPVPADPAGNIWLPGYAAPGPFPEIVLFGFDEWAFPFQNNVETRLIPGTNPQVVLRHGPPGSHDEVLLYYGTVIRVGDELRMWYTGNFGRERNQIGYERENCCIAYATSRDGIHWEKPDLGLVEFNGSKKNNIVDFPDRRIWSTCAILHDTGDPDLKRRFKMAYEAAIGGHNKFCVAFSPDGFHWKPYSGNPVGPFLEMAGVARHGSLFLVSGQPDFTVNHLVAARRLATFVSADFEHWSPIGAVGLDRATDLAGPSGDDRRHQFEEIHLGAALWNRGNVLIGTYGQWHGHPSGDRRWVTMDIGLAITHDGIHYHEPIRDFRLVPAREQPEAPAGVEPALVQGQGMENIGDQTMYWYSIWRGTEGSGVRLVTWQRDRIGMLKPFRRPDAQTISCPIEVRGSRARAFVNAGGLGESAHLRVELVDAGFRPIPGFSGAGTAEVRASAFDAPLRWAAGDTLPSEKTFRMSIQFAGVRPEDASLYAMYLKTA
jgi:hypothetical protein